MARPGHERFTEPTASAHRRYEALRAYFVEELAPGEITERFGDTKASVQTLISTYRDADLSGLFQSSRPGPKRQWVLHYANHHGWALHIRVWITCTPGGGKPRSTPHHPGTRS